jgi:hypothetical protein
MANINTLLATRRNKPACFQSFYPKLIVQLTEDQKSENGLHFQSSNEVKFTVGLVLEDW